MPNKNGPDNMDSTSNLITGVGAKIGKKGLKAGKVVVKKLILLLVKTIGLPLLIVAVVILLLVSSATYVFFGERGSMSEYNIDANYNNTLEYVQEGDITVPVAEDVSDENKLVELYYKFMSIQSYYKTIDGGKNILSFAEDTDDFSKYSDYYGKENMYYLNNYFLLTLDETAHRYNFRYPEQFIKLVYADIEERKLKELVDDKGYLTVTSTEYVNDLPTENKVLGVWDYGFAPLLYYGEYEKEDYIEGIYIQKDIQVGNDIETVAIQEPFRLALPDSKKDIYLIDNAISQSGDIKYNYEMGDLYLRDFTDGSSSDEATEYVKYRYDTAYLTETEIIDGEVVVSTYAVPLYKYRTGMVLEHLPVHVSSDENLTGTDYLKSYLHNYEVYVPDGVMEDFSFKDRADDQQDLIDRLSILNVFAGETSSSKIPINNSMNNIDIGSRVNTDSYDNALQYLEYFEEYGSKYGVEPYLLVAMASQESSGQHDKYCNSKGPVGIMQIEPPKSINTTDVNGNDVRIHVQREDLFDIEVNIETSAAYLKYCMEFFNDNTLMAIQGYNFGPTGTKKIVESYAEKNGKTYKEVRDNHEDLGWMDHRVEYTNGGDKLYIEHVLPYYSNAPEEIIGVIEEKNNEEFGAVDVVDAIAQSNNDKGWLQKAWSNITEGFNSLISNIQEAFTTSYGEEMFYYKNNMVSLDIDSALSQTLSLNNYSNYYSSYHDFKMSGEGDGEELSFLFLGSSKYFGGIGGGSAFIEGIASALEGFINPTQIEYRTSSPFGPRVDPINGGYAFHNGIDYAMPEGTPLYAVNDGIVNYSGWKKSYGNIVELNIGKFHVKYAHMSKLILNQGEEIKKGQLIGYSGSTGDSTGPHLHFEVLLNGERINPALYFFK